MFSTKRLTWLVGIATLLSFVGVTIFSLINPSRDIELVRFTGLNSIRRSDLLAEVQRQRRKFGSADTAECLNILVTERVTDAFCKEHHMDCSNEVIINLLKRMPYFWTEDKGFDQSKFDNYLKSEGSGAEEYIEKVKKDLLCKLAINIFADSCNSSYLANALSANRLSLRDIVIAHCDVRNVLPPSEPELLATYARCKKEFYVPELRSVKYFTVNRTTSVSDAEVRAYFAKNSSNIRGSLSSTHKQIASIIATEKDRAKLAELRSCISDLLSEKDFEKLAKKFDSKVSSLEKAKFSDLARLELFSSSSKEIFSAEAKVFADPSVTQNKFLIWYVSGISHARLLDFADAKHLVIKKCIESKKQALSSQRIVALRAKLDSANVTAQTFIKEAGAAQAHVQTFEGINSATKVLSADLLKVVLGLRQGEVSSAIFDSSTGKTYIILVKNLKRYAPKPQDVRLDKEELRRAIFFEIQSYLARKYNPTMVNSISS
jgi:hypothetical protein